MSASSARGRCAKGLGGAFTGLEWPRRWRLENAFGTRPVRSPTQPTPNTCSWPATARGLPKTPTWSWPWDNCFGMAPPSYPSALLAQGSAPARLKPNQRPRALCRFAPSMSDLTSMPSAALALNASQRAACSQHAALDNGTHIVAPQPLAPSRRASRSSPHSFLGFLAHRHHQTKL